MRPRKSSTLIKKADALISTKEPSILSNFSTNHSYVSQFESPCLPIKGKFEVRGNLNKGSINPTSNFRRTFSRAKNDNMPTEIKKADTPLAIEKQSWMLHQNSSKEPFTKGSFQQEKAPEIKQQKIHKTRVAFYQSASKANDKKAQGSIAKNPEQKAQTKKGSSFGKRQQMLNTRRSKFQSEVKKKQVVEKQSEKQKSLITPLKKSKNINIHTIKHASVKRGETGQKLELKNEEVENEQKFRKEDARSEEKQVQIHQTIKKEQNPKIETQAPRVEFGPSVRKAEQSVRSQQQQRGRETNNMQNPVHLSNRPVQSVVPQNLPLASSPQANNLNSDLNQTQLTSQIDQSEMESIRYQMESIRFQPAESRVTQSRIRQQSNQSQNERVLNLTALIANTQDIITFINRLNLSNRVQAFDLMVGQLTQLNIIAQQVQQLGQIGNNLGYSLVNVFGTRIRQLQTTIINQVGLALIASFEQRVDPEFEALVQMFVKLRIREPSLRQGFSRGDIEKTFEEKITFEEAECSICLQNVKRGELLIELQCFHEYHPICIRTWLQNSRKCPMCRMEQKL